MLDFMIPWHTVQDNQKRYNNNQLRVKEVAMKSLVTMIQVPPSRLSLFLRKKIRFHLFITYTLVSLSLLLLLLLLLLISRSSQHQTTAISSSNESRKKRKRKSDSDSNKITAHNEQLAVSRSHCSLPERSLRGNVSFFFSSCSLLALFLLSSCSLLSPPRDLFARANFLIFVSL